MAWVLYASDAGDRLALNLGSYIDGVHRSPAGCWVTGNAVLDGDPATITRGTLFPYAQALKLYHCPADHSCVAGTSTPRLRSVSLSGYMGERIRDQLPGPAADEIRPRYAHPRSPSRFLTRMKRNRRGHIPVFLQSGRMARTSRPDGIRMARCWFLPTAMRSTGSGKDRRQSPGSMAAMSLPGGTSGPKASPADSPGCRIIPVLLLIRLILARFAGG